MAICSCPAATTLTTIPKMECADGFGQIQKIAFQRIYSSGTTKNSMTKASVLLVATWTPLLTATDGTKVVVTPYVEAPTQDGGDEITFGGGNDTVDGIERNVGRNPMRLTTALRDYPQSIIKVLKELQCEQNLGVYLFDGEGRIEALTDGTNVFPIPIRNLFVGDKQHGGFSEPDSNALAFSFAPNYSDNLAIFTPTDFNPLTDL